MVKATLLDFSLLFIQIPFMSKKMTSDENFNAINVTLENLKGVTNAIRNIQNEKILKLF